MPRPSHPIAHGPQPAQHLPGGVTASLQAAWCWHHLRCLVPDSLKPGTSPSESQIPLKPPGLRITGWPPQPQCKLPTCQASTRATVPSIPFGMDLCRVFWGRVKPPYCANGQYLLHLSQHQQNALLPAWLWHGLPCATGAGAGAMPRWRPLGTGGGFEGDARLGLGAGIGGMSFFLIPGVSQQWRAAGPCMQQPDAGLIGTVLPGTCSGQDSCLPPAAPHPPFSTSRDTPEQGLPSWLLRLG